MVANDPFRPAPLSFLQTLSARLRWSRRRLAPVASFMPLVLALLAALLIAACGGGAGGGGALAPSMADLHFNQGMSFGQQGRHKLALEEFRKAAKLEPGRPQTHNNLGFALANLGRYGEALKAYQEAVRLLPNYINIYLNMAAALGHMNRNDEGLRALEEAIRLNPSLAVSSESLGRRLKLTRIPPVPNPPQRLRFRGYSIIPPIGKYWYIQDQSPISVNFTKGTARGEFHTVLAFTKMEFLIIKNNVELLRKIRAGREKKNKSNSRFKNSEFKVSLDSSLGKECVKVEFNTEDYGVPYAPKGSIFFLVGRDFFCRLNPPNKEILIIGFSQRFLLGEKPLPLEKEIGSFMKSVNFSPKGPAPRCPALSDGVLEGSYHKDKKYFHLYGPNPLFFNALLEGKKLVGVPGAPTTFTDEQKIAIEYDVLWSVKKSGLGKYDIGVQLGVVLGEVGCWEAALEAFRNATGRDPTATAPGTWGNLGVAAHVLGRYKESTGAFKKASELDPTYFDTRKIQRKIWEASRNEKSIQ